MDSNRLVELLASPDPAVRIRAIESAGEAGKPDVVLPLAQQARTEPNAQVRCTIALTLARLATPQAITTLRLLAGDADSVVRCRVLECLFRIQDESVFALSIRMISDVDAEVKKMAFQILRRLGKDGVMRLIGRILQGADLRWKVYAVSALGQVASAEGVAVLARLLGHEAQEIRQQAKASLLNLARHGNEAAALVVKQLPGSPTAGSVNQPFGRNADETGEVAPPQSLSMPISVPGPRPGFAAPAASPSNPTASNNSGPFRTSGSESSQGSKSFMDPSQPVQRKFSTAKYKALFGESMPRMRVPLPPEPPPPPEEEPSGAEAVSGAEAPMSGGESNSGAEETEGERKKKSKNYKDNVCRDCVFAKTDRPDKQKMGPGRLWCGMFKKEIKATYSCPRGKW